MAVSHNQFVQIIDYQTYLSQQVLNVYYYRTVYDGGTGTLTMLEILDAFNDALMEAICDIQHVFLTHVSLAGLNLSDGITIGDLPTGVNGNQAAAGDALASFITCTIRLIRGSAVTRHGYKRFAGLPEQFVDLNGLAGTGITNANALATLLHGDLTVATGKVIRPVIIKRPLGILPNPLESVYSDVVDADVRNLGTQNTRKVGRGG